MKLSHQILGVALAGPLFFGSSLLFSGSAQAAECSSDSDCAAYLECKASSYGEGSCSNPSCPDGDCEEQATECTLTEHEGPKTCRPRHIECKANSDCPADFECTTYAATGCVGGSNPQCQESESKACTPKRIECASSAQCPSDWACTSFSGKSDDCWDTSESPGSGGSSPADPAPGTPAAKCETIKRSICVPPGFINDSSVSEIDGQNGSHTLGGDEEAAAASDGEASSSDDSGCSVAHVGSTRSGSALLTMLGLGFIARLAGRRSRRA